MGVFQSVGGAATSGRGFTGRQVAQALKAAAEAQKQRHVERVTADAALSSSAHRRTRSTVVQTLDDLEDGVFDQTCEIRTQAPAGEDGSNEMVDIIVTEYAPEAFRYLRQLEGVLETQFATEWDIPEERLKLELGEGRSMAMFLKSKSMEFMCKTISDVEVNVLLGILKDYVAHLSRNRHSLLMRFLMLLKVQVGQEVGYILCFADIFAGCNSLNERWDIKGRYPKPGKYRQFPKWADQQMNAIHDGLDSPKSIPSKETSPKLITRKDKDLTRLFWLDEQHREELLDQLQQDFTFLRSCGLMDYSVLVGVKYGQDTEHHRRAEAMRMTFALGEEGLRGIKEVRVARDGSPDHYDPSIITHNSKYHYGIFSTQGHETYYIGIIDMLTVYNWKKKTANFCKTFLWKENTLSTIPPRPYEQRIDKYANRIFASATTKRPTDASPAAN